MGSGMGKKMPLSEYNKEFGGKKGSAEKAHSAMSKEYGAERGEKIFYATKNKRKKSALVERAVKG